jgi:prepilin-type N-terminal cleavage/methylation domain-containing protein
MTRRAFTLVEVVAALAIFAFVAIVVGQASFNSLNAVSRLKKDSMSDAYKDFMREQIVTVSDLNELRSGMYVQDANGEQVRIFGDAEATEILDLFILRVSSKDTDYEDVFYLQRPAWYDQITTRTSRDDMLRDRKEGLEETRRQSYTDVRRGK